MVDDVWSRRLGACVNYAVVGEDGRRVGVVAWVVYGSRPDRPDALAVRPSLLRRRITLMSVERVLEIKPHDQLVVVSAAEVQRGELADPPDQGVH